MGTLLSAANWPIVGQIAILLGKVMNVIYNTLDNVLPTDHGLVGWSIIIYTILVYTLMLPLTVNQQKTSRMTALMNPEIKAIQKKYQNKKDQASMMKQQEEIQQVYDKYGTSMMGGCLPLLIQMPLLFALYPVIYDMSNYVPAIAKASDNVQRFFTLPNLSMSPIAMIKARDTFDVAPALVVITCILLPIISAATQYGSIKLSQAISGVKNNSDKNDPMNSTMKTMNMTMPLMSVFFVATLPTGIGLYWIFSALVRSLQQVLINKHLKQISVEDLIEKNKDKAEKKAKKRSEKAERINEMAQMNARSLKDSANRQVSAMSQKERDEKLENARKNAEHAKPGSLASKANMVKHFNENN